MTTEESKEKRVVVIKEMDEFVALPTTRIRCPQCGNSEAYWWMLQMRAADEPPTIFHRCTRCNYTWRE